MPDFQNFQVEMTPDSSPAAGYRFRVSLRVTDGKTGATIADFTGTNSVNVLLRVDGLSVPQHKRLAEYIAYKVMGMRLGADADS